MAARPVVEASSARRSGTSATSETSGADDPSARRTEVASSGSVTSGTWAPRAARPAAPSGAGSRPSHDDPVGDDRPTRSPLVGLRVLGLGTEIRGARASHRGLLEPALDVLLR
jgi:hypothetical protein